MAKIAILKSQHLEVARLFEESLDEVLCMAGNPNAEDLLKVTDVVGRVFWCDEIEFKTTDVRHLPRGHEEDPVSDKLLEKAAVEAFKQIVDLDKNSFFEIFKAGAQWKQQQLMKDAVDGSVCAQRPNGEVIVRTNFIRADLALMEKVKLIIIKK